MKLILFIHVYDIIFYINCVFCFVQVRAGCYGNFFHFVVYLAIIQVNICRTIGTLVGNVEDLTFKRISCIPHISSHCSIHARSVCRTWPSVVELTARFMTKSSAKSLWVCPARAGH